MTRVIPFDSTLADRNLKIISFGRIAQNITYPSIREAFKSDPNIISGMRHVLGRISTVIKDKNVICSEGAGEEVVQAFLKFPKIIIERNFQPSDFYHGTGDWTDVFVEEGRINLPFPKICVVTGQLEEERTVLGKTYVTVNGENNEHSSVNRFAFHIATQDGDGILVHSFLAVDAESSQLHIATTRLAITQTSNGTLKVFPHVHSEQVGWLNIDSVAQIARDVLRAIYMMTYHTGEAYISIPTPRDVEVNQKKLRKGKTPLIEFRLISITGKKPPEPSTPHGTHASPRQHWRRGHWRTYKSGKRSWVEPMLVGDEANGKIIKDYAVGHYKEKRYDWASQTQ